MKTSLSPSTKRQHPLRFVPTFPPKSAVHVARDIVTAVVGGQVVTVPRTSCTMSADGMLTVPVTDDYR